MIADNITLHFNEQDKPQLSLSLTMSRHEALQAFKTLKEVVAKGKHLSVEIKQYRAKKSLDANNYCWLLCQKIAEVIHSTKEEVYQKAIRDVGQFEIMPIRNDAVETFIYRWSAKGLGWHAEVLDDSKLDGYKKIIGYFGASVYDSKEMSVLIDYIVDECKELNIETLTPSEIERLKAEWGN